MTKYVRVRWDGWNWKAFIFDESVLQECLKDGSIRLGDEVYEVKKKFMAVQDKPAKRLTIKLEEEVKVASPS